MPSEVMIRPMTREEMDLALRWAAEEGWNPGIHDAEAFYQACPSGFFVADRGGEVVGTVSLVSYPGDMSFAGFLMVRPDMRGRGVGGLLIRHLLEAGNDRNIGGDGVPAMLPTYIGKGFKFAYWHHRFQGVGGGNAVGGPAELADTSFEELVRYDKSIFLAPREDFLRAFLRQEGTRTLVSIESGRIDGYGAIRPCQAGYRVGPLFADDRATAERILRALIATIPGEPYFLDVPEPNAHGMALAHDLGLVDVSQAGRIYSKSVPDVPLVRVFGTASLELG